MMKLRIATGLGLLLFIATMIGGPVRVSPAQADEDGVASLAGNFAGRGSGFFTICFNATFTAVADCATVPASQRVPFDVTQVEQFIRDAAGNSCGVLTETIAPVSGTKFAATANTRTDVGTITSFDPTTGSGKESFSLYFVGSCTGAAFNGSSADLAATGNSIFVVSDSGNRIEIILTSVSAVTNHGNVAGGLQGFVFSQTAIRQGHLSD
jgi:hypothetical protein